MTSNRPDPATELDQLRQEVERLRAEAAQRDRTDVATALGHAGHLAVSEAGRAIAEVDARAAWARAAELGRSLSRRIAEGQARLMASRAAIVSLERANESLVAGQAAIALREADLRAVIERAIDCAIVTTDRDGLILAWNTGAHRLLGWDEAGALAMDLKALVPPEAQEVGALAADLALALSGRAVSREGWLLRQDGTRFWAAIEATAVRAEGAEDPAWILWMLRDRSAARRTEMALRESEARHRLLIESWAQAVWETDGDGVVVTDSPSWRAYTGQTVEEWMGYGWLDAIHPDDRAHAERKWREAVTSRGVVDAQFRLRAPDGGWRWTNVRAAPLPGVGGRIEKWVGMNIDIGARRSAEAALRDSEERHRSLFEAIDDGYLLAEVLYDASGAPADILFLEANPAAVRIAGRDFTGRRLREVDPAYETEWIEAYDRVVQTGEPLHAERYAAPHDRWFEFRAIRLGGPGRRRVAVLFRDVTERHQAQERERKRQELHAFLLRFSDALRSQHDAEAVIGTGARLLGEHLGASRVIFAEFDHERGIAEIFHGWFADGAGPLPVVMQLKDYEGPILRDLRDGRIVRVEDATDPSSGRPDLAAIAELGVKGLLSVPLLVGGRLAVNLSIHQHGPRRWTDEEVELARDIAERLWADLVRARAEAATRDREERLRSVLDGMTEGFGLLAPDFTILEHNLEALRMDGRPREEIIGRSHWEVYAGSEDSELGRLLHHAMRDRVPVTLEHRYGFANGQALWLDMRAYPTRDGSLAVFWRDVSDRKAAEAALRESEARYRMLFEAMDEAYAVVEVLRDAAGRWHDFRFVEVNPAFIQHTSMPWPVGKTATELLGTPNPRWAQLYGQALDTDAPLRVQEAEPVLGRVFDLNIFSLDRARNRVAVLFTDITARHHAEAALRESEERLRGFAENSADILWMTDAEGRRLDYLSPAFERSFGEPRDRILADIGRFRELVHPEDRDAVSGFLARVLAGETVIAHYRVVRPADGRVVHLRDTAFPIRDAMGRITRAAGITQDVTDLHEATVALEAEKESFRTLAEGIPQLVWRSGEEGRWTWSSPQWQAFTGQDQDRSQGLGWLENVHPEDHEATRLAWRQAAASGRLEVEHRIRRASDGAWRWFSTQAVPLRHGPGADEAAAEWLGTATDIDDLKRLQGQQQLLLAELQHRTRNLLGVVRAIAGRSFEPSPRLELYEARLGALSRVQGFLSGSPDYAARLGDIVRAELSAVAGGALNRIRLEGPSVELPGEGLHAVSLALHELATNAVKYGAIAQPEGRLSVTWRIEAEPNGARRLVLDWQESGVSLPAQPPSRQGYGSELITRALPYQLNAETELEFNPDGVRCRIILLAGAFQEKP